MKLLKIIQVGRQDLISFIDFPYSLYKNDIHYVPYMRHDLKKTLKKLLFREKSYTALLAVDETGSALGRVLFTIAENKQLHTAFCGFFSLYECVDDFSVSDALLGEMTRRLKASGAQYVSGSFFPYDPDNRRGILFQGFERAPLIFTSYNPPYYNDQLVHFGMKKQTDAYQYRIDLDYKPEHYRKLAEYAKSRYNIRVDHLNRKHPEQDIRDFQLVMQEATTAINYQDAPSLDELEKIFKSWKRFLVEDYVVILRRIADNKPVGIALVIPDYFELFRKMRGRLDIRGLWILAAERGSIHSVRALLQYIIPEYQKTGIYAAAFSDLQQTMHRRAIRYAEAGTIMENNADSNNIIRHVGGELSRVYRIYYMNLAEI